ncbi:MAG: patatin-like phospholipase family protein [Alcaligenaceae bacterium]|nr:patatin-like phospholipase family protein [Alcaligenaceae bacterium]
MEQSQTTALVLGGGGVTGIAWLIGVLAGLARYGFVLPRNCHFIGTSAGSVVSTELANGISPDSLLNRQLDTQATSSESFRAYSQREADQKNQVLMQKTGGDLVLARLRIGAFALRKAGADLGPRREIIRSRLTLLDWPVRKLSLIAVDAQSAEHVTLTRDSGLPLIDAVMASCAVPGVWPTVPWNGRLLMDGGIRSMTNADLASGSSNVLVLAPLGYSQENPVSGHLQAEIKELERAGARVDVVTPDAVSLSEIGDNVLDPSRSQASALAGLAQASDVCNSISAPWFCT